MASHTRVPFLCFASRDISTRQLKLARHLHVGHYFLLTHLHPEAPDLFERAKRMGLTTSLDCNYDPSEKWNSRIEQVLRHTDIFFPNDQEALLLTGRRSVEAAARELGKLARIVAVKLGAEGVLMFHDGDSFRVPARKVRVVDTTGAGDSFNAGFLSQFLRGASLQCIDERRSCSCCALRGQGRRNCCFRAQAMTVQTGTTAVVVHTGGPTPVINASLVGVIEEARKHSAIEHLLGARFGFDGVLKGQYFDLFKQKEETIRAIATTPSSALGTSRRELTASDLECVLNELRLRNVRHLFVTGGNGSMETARQIQDLALQRDRDLQVIGIPKTIDNDLLETHHTPGYGSAARFFACAARDIGADNKALPGQVEIIEVLGRNVGWLAAATVACTSRAG